MITLFTGKYISIKVALMISVASEGVLNPILGRTNLRNRFFWINSGPDIVGSTAEEFLYSGTHCTRNLISLRPYSSWDEHILLTRILKNPNKHTHMHKHVELTIHK